MNYDSAPTLFTIPPGTPFLQALAEALVADPSLAGALSSEREALADLTILLPTRRAVRSLSEAFLRAGGGKAILLPRIRPMGDVDEDELLLTAGLENEMVGGLDLPPAIDGMDRQLRLSRLVLAWGKDNEFGPTDVGQAAALAAELAHLIDSAETEGVDLSQVKTLVPDRFAEHWQHTLTFLQIALDYWPEELSQLGLVDPAKRRNMAIRAQVQAWKDRPPMHPVIAAGSTGSIPATAELLSQVARMQKGAVILPGLDQALDPRGWQAVGPSHPQYGMKQLLGRMEATRDQVRLWPHHVSSELADARAALMSEALRPAETTDAWSGIGRDIVDGATAIRGLSLIEAPTPREEAGAIAAALRELLERGGQTGVLVTPDRSLARRVAEELGRWDIPIDDSAGQPLSTVLPFAFLRLIATAASESLAPVVLLEVLKHPMTALGLSARECRHRTRLLEREILRGARPAPGIEGLRLAFASARQEREIDPVLDDLIDRLEAAIKPLMSLYENAETSLQQIAQAHLLAAEAFSASDEETGADRLYKGDAGEATALFMENLLTAGEGVGQFHPLSYLRLLETLSAGRMVRPRFGQHPRLSILGPLEARLMSADLVILAGLNEEIWPAASPIDAWLSRPMREELGLEPPERRIGLSAHDFQQAACGRHIILTRSVKVEGTPTVASRWLLRLQSLLKGHGIEDGLVPDQRLLAITARLDAPAVVQSVDPPSPTPSIEDRPKSYSVTNIETLIRDPYAIYARKVLRLYALDPLDSDAGAIERGIVLHAALEAFAKHYPGRLPDDPEAALLELGRQVFDDAPDRPGVTAFWWPRYRDVARWLSTWEPEVRAGMAYTHAEVRGEMLLKIGTRALVLSAIADRLDERTDGTFSIYDYKTGTPPSKKQVEAGLSPQLPLEAAIAQAGGFTTNTGVPLPSRPVGALSYLHLSGGDTGASERNVATDGSAAAAEALEGLTRLLSHYEKPDTPYLSRPRVQFQGRAGDYDHLARVLEWSAADKGGDV